MGRPDGRREEGPKGKNWKTDPSGGIIRGHEGARLPPLWQCQGACGGLELPDPIPQHREPLYGTRPDMVAKYPTHEDKKAFWRLPTLFKTVQDKNMADKVYEKFPLILTSGRLVEYEGGGEETRSNPGWPSCSRKRSWKSTPRPLPTAAFATASRVWLSSPTGARLNVQAWSPSGGADTVWMPFHFSGRWQGADMKRITPRGMRLWCAARP